MRSTLLLVPTAIIVVVICWVVKYGEVEDVAVRVADKSTGNPIDTYWIFRHSRPDSRNSHSPEGMRVANTGNYPFTREEFRDVDMWFAAPGYRPRLLRPADMSWSSWLRFGETVVLLEPGTTLKGVVRDAAGQPVKGATVLAEMRPAMELPPLPEPLAHTSADGTFEIPDLRPFIEDVKVFQEGLGAGHCGMSEIMEISIQGGEVICHMLDEGKPIENLWVIAESYADTRQTSAPWWHATEKTDARGEVRFDAFPTGRTKIWTQQIFQDGAWQNYFRFDDKSIPSGSVFIYSGPERKLEKWVSVDRDKTIECVIETPTIGGKP